VTLHDLAEAMRARKNVAATRGLTEDELAAEFTRRHQHRLRYVAPWGV
jgi:hypothetical protein